MVSVIIKEKYNNVSLPVNFDGNSDELIRHMNQYKFVLFEDEEKNEYIVNTSNIFYIIIPTSAKNWTIKTYIEYLKWQSETKILTNEHILELLTLKEYKEFTTLYPELIGIKWNQIPHLKNFSNIVKDQNFIGLMSSYFDIEL